MAGKRLSQIHSAEGGILLVRTTPLYYSTHVQIQHLHAPASLRAGTAMRHLLRDTDLDWC